MARAPEDEMLDELTALLVELRAGGDRLRAAAADSAASAHKIANDDDDNEGGVDA